MLITKLYALISLLILISTNTFAEDEVSHIYCGQMLDVESEEIIDGVMISVDPKTEKVIEINSNIPLADANNPLDLSNYCLLYTSDAADE